MTLPVSGPISFNNINVELGVSGTTQASLGQTSYRTLAGVASGAISMSNFYGKANQFAFTISSNTANLDVRAAALSAGWNGSSQVVCTINSGVYVYSNSTGSPALTISGSFPGGVQLTNNGSIYGRGGDGGGGARVTGQSAGQGVAAVPGGGGGTALYVASAATVVNNGGIYGGGGGGGGGAAGTYKNSGSGGGGGGGGIGGSSAGIGGTATGVSTGSSGQAGQAGTLVSAGTGGAGGFTSAGGVRGGTGGTGGGWGSTGASGAQVTYTFIGNIYALAAGGAAGSSVSGNSFITWSNTGTRVGPIN